MKQNTLQPRRGEAVLLNGIRREQSLGLLYILGTFEYKLEEVAVFR